MARTAPYSTRHSHQTRVRLAAAYVGTGHTYLSAATEYSVPLSTLHAFVERSKRPVVARIPRGRLTCLLKHEESIILGILTKYANYGISLNRNHLLETVKILRRRMTTSRRIFLPFRQGKPGRKWLRGFVNRHKDTIRFRRPLKPEAALFRACNAETLVTHFATLTKIIEEHNLDETRIWNLDETGVTAGKDVTGAPSRKYYMTHRGCTERKIAEFVNTNRVTMMPVVSADGDLASPLFVFKGKRLPYRRVIRNEEAVVENYATFLPRKAIITARETLGGVEKDNFFQWAVNFVREVRHLTAEGKTLLIYDGYRSHMSLAVLELFYNNNIIVYALPAHTSGKTQPLDVTVFCAFKNALNEVMASLITTDPVNTWNSYDPCSMIRHAYDKSFTRDNIRSGFRRSGVWPVDPWKLYSVPRPAAFDRTEEVLSTEQMLALYDAKCKEMRFTILGENATLSKSGWIDTQHGAVLTSYKALKLAREKAENDNKKRLEQEANACLQAARAARRDTVRRAEAEALQNAQAAQRAAQFGLDVVAIKKQARPLAERRAIARMNVIEKRRADF